MMRNLPLRDEKGESLRYAAPDEVQELLHFVDQHASGAIAIPESVLGDEAAKRHYIVNSLMEEAIRSSQLEGANTTRVAAKELIRSGRKPQDRSERMIVNNYNAMLFMREEVGDRLYPEAVLELHRRLTEGTLDDPGSEGRLQTPGEERVVVWDEQEGRLLHRPPPAAQLSERLNTMCRFANGDEETDGFLHPVLRAILLHFWLAYDHPFVDGNGRTARALFYWSMRVQGYWITEFLSISRLLRQAPMQYGRSFLYTETDGGDTTYFLLYQLKVIKRAIEELHDYLERKLAEISAVERVLKGSDHFNHRQLALLGNAVRNPTQRYTFRSHAVSHRVSHESARQDLLELTRLGYLEKRRVGRRYWFFPSDDLPQRLGGTGHR